MAQQATKRDLYIDASSLRVWYILWWLRERIKNKAIEIGFKHLFYIIYKKSSINFFSIFNCPPLLDCFLIRMHCKIVFNFALRHDYDVNFTYCNHSINQDSAHWPMGIKMLRPIKDYLVRELNRDVMRN